jgi:hypothetical protein
MREKKRCRECGIEFAPDPPQALVCSDRCRRSRARRAKRTYRRKAIGRFVEARHRATPRAMELARERARKHYEKRRGVRAWVAYWEWRLARFKERRRREVAHA